MVTETNKYQDQILKQKIALFLYGNHYGAFANIVVACATVWLLWGRVPHTQALAWLFGMVFFSLYLVITSPKNKDLTHLTLPEIQHVLHRYLPGLAGTCFFWGLSGWVMFVDNSWRDQSILIMVALGVATASLPIMSPLLKIFKIHLITCSAPIIIHLAIDQNAEANIFAVLGSIMIILILQAATKLHDATDNSLASNFHNENLVEQLQEAIIKADAASQVKSDFLGNISHELRTPMNAIVGFSDYLKGTDLDEQQNDSLDIIRSSSKSLLSLINNILDFAKIESGNVALQNKVFTLKAEIEKIAQPFQDKAKNKGIHFKLLLDPKVPTEILGDVARLKQILCNLLHNALKFTEQGDICLSIQQLTTKEDTLFIQFTVEDTGVGIPTNKIQNIFNSFEQVDNSVTREYGGSGLGLSITEKLVTMMGGHIQVRSAENQGAVFFFNIPFQVVKNPVVPSKQSSEFTLPDLKGKNILLVEDNIFNQKIASILVEKMNPNLLLIANNGLEALGYLQNEDFFCVLMDLQMPVMGGLEATEKIRSQAVSVRNTQVPIIALTAHARPKDKQECMDVGMDDYLSKPYKSEDLYAIFARLLSKEAKIMTFSEEA